jgi:hypothetical protein
MSFDKKTKMAKRRNADEVKIAEASRLNPKLPYRIVVFPYDFFGVENLVPKKEEKEVRNCLQSMHMLRYPTPSPCRRQQEVHKHQHPIHH